MIPGTECLRAYNTPIPYLADQLCFTNAGLVRDVVMARGRRK
jgi:hypothetical protein